MWKYKGEWEKMSDRVGYWADMDNPYVTYDDNQNIAVVAVFDFKARDGGILFNKLISLRHLVRGKRGAATRAIGHGTRYILAEALVSKFFEDYNVINKKLGKEWERLEYEP